MAPTPGQATSSAPPTGSGRGDSALDVRYGRTRSYRLRRRWIAVIAGAVIIVVFGAWVLFAAFDGTSASIDSNDAGYTIVSDTQATVRSEISVDPGTKVDCSIQVLDSSFDVVGFKIVHFPASAVQSNVYQTSLHTTARGVTGLISKCWLP